MPDFINASATITFKWQLKKHISLLHKKYFSNIAFHEELNATEVFAGFSNLNRVSCISLCIFTFLFVILSYAHPIFMYKIILHNFLCLYLF